MQTINVAAGEHPDTIAWVSWNTSSQKTINSIEISRSKLFKSISTQEIMICPIWVSKTEKLTYLNFVLEFCYNPICTFLLCLLALATWTHHGAMKQIWRIILNRSVSIPCWIQSIKYNNTCRIINFRVGLLQICWIVG